MHPGQPITALQRFFTGLAEQVFQVELGVADPPLIDYLSQLLVRFIHADQLHRWCMPAGPPGQDLQRLLAEADQRVGLAQRALYRHIGDVTLFWAGLYPEHLRQTQVTADVDRFGQYCAAGRRSYLAASRIDADAGDAAPGDVLARLGTEFEMCAYGLREVRRGWEEEADRP
ncbi:MAG: hypothetical protein MUF48_07960 [Pirellulaceae bacterium]|jgi:hypothetical protein|nr:hypothetical protein [Pirellulaceae bacterium]